MATVDITATLSHVTLETLQEHVRVFGRQENTSKRQTGHGKEAYKNCKQQSLNFWVSQNFFIEEDV